MGLWAAITIDFYWTKYINLMNTILDHKRGTLIGDWMVVYWLIWSMDPLSGHCQQLCDWFNSLSISKAWIMIRSVDTVVTTCCITSHQKPWKVYTLSLFPRNMIFFFVTFSYFFIVGIKLKYKTSNKNKKKYITLHLAMCVSGYRPSLSLGHRP